MKTDTVKYSWKVRRVEHRVLMCLCLYIGNSRGEVNSGRYFSSLMQAVELVSKLFTATWAIFAGILVTEILYRNNSEYPLGIIQVRFMTQLFLFSRFDSFLGLFGSLIFSTPIPSPHHHAATQVQYNHHISRHFVWQTESCTNITIISLSIILVFNIIKRTFEIQRVSFEFETTIFQRNHLREPHAKR